MHPITSHLPAVAFEAPADQGANLSEAAPPGEQPAPDEKQVVQVEPAKAETDTVTIPEAVPGVPLYTLETPEGFGPIAWLTHFDLDAKHEIGQPAQSPPTDQSEPIPLRKSGGSAYYSDFSTGKGFSVALNPEEA